jgi:SAM-dependent methyltransferase
MRGTVLLVTHDDARSIAPVLQEIDESRALLGRSDISLDVLIVDDSSNDATLDLARAEADQLGLDLTIVKSPATGRIAALRAGFDQLTSAADSAFVVTLDGDGQHDARQIPDLVRAHLAGGLGITIGSRWVRGGSAPGSTPRRSLTSRVGNQLARTVARIDGIRDATSGFRVLHPDVLTFPVPPQVLTEASVYFAALTALAQAHGFAVEEVPITFRPRYSQMRPLERGDGSRFLVGLWETRRAGTEARASHRADQTHWAKRQPHFAGQNPTPDSHFGALDELESLAGATNFFTWIVEGFGNAIGPRTVEVGAGLGTVSRAIAAVHPDTTVLALEPAANVYPSAAERLASHPQITLRQATSGDLLAEGAADRFDTAVYVNVLEHIEDDEGELEVARQLLAPGGRLCLFVPAMPSLYSAIDHKSGHFRRYTKDTLRGRVERAGFTVDTIDYFDVASVLPYWLMYRVLGVETLGGGSNAIYDKVIVPTSKALQRVIVHPPIGKNLILVARRSR